MGGDLRFTSCAYHLNDVDASANIHGTCGYIGFGAGDIISERAGTDNLFHASYDLRYANCSSDIRFASCAYHFNDVDASANIHGTSSAHDIRSSDDVCCASDNLCSTCGTDLHSANIHGTSSAHDLCGSDDVCCASDNLRSACGYTDNLFP